MISPAEKIVNAKALHNREVRHQTVWRGYANFDYATLNQVLFLLEGTTGSRSRILSGNGRMNSNTVKLLCGAAG